jgi:hypothetical protein
MINTQLANCLWNDFEGHHKIHLANWQSICMKKEAGGLNVPNLRDLNMCLLGSWVRRYHKDEWSLWRKVVDAKYNTVPKIQISFVAMMEILLNFGKVFVGETASGIWIQMEDWKWKNS